MVGSSEIESRPEGFLTLPEVIRERFPYLRFT